MKNIFLFILLIAAFNGISQTIPVKPTDSLYIIETKVTVISKVVPPANPINHSPTAFAGNTQTITLPVNSIVLNGTANDVDNNIKTTVWTKSTSLASTIVSPNSLSTSVTGLVQGTHIFKLTVTDDSGAVASSTVNIVVNPAPVVDTSRIKIEGFGANAVGGGNSATVYHVTNLNNSGSGSLAGGIGSNKTIVFDVAGVIYNTRLDLIGVSYLTIDGSSAPSPGIILDGKNANGSYGLGGDVVSFDGSTTHHCILKSIEVRNAGNDCINVLDGSHDIAIVNCSSYNAVDGECDIAGGNNVTIQYCVFGSSATGGPGCVLITATNVSLHHNLMSPAAPGTPGERCPLVHCNYSPVGNPNADIRNNLVWRFGRDNGSGSGYGSAVAYNAVGNIVNNYYYTDGSSKNNATSTSDGYGTGNTGKAYIAGNVSGNGGTANAPSTRGEVSIAVQYQVITEDACTAAKKVLQLAGTKYKSAKQLSIISGAKTTGCPL